MDHIVGTSCAERSQAAAGPDLRLETLEHDLALSREIRRRLEAEGRRLEVRNAALESEARQLRAVVQERERYLEAIHRSLVWRLAQALRRLVGRAW